MNKLENSFHEEMFQIYHQAKKYYNYNATRFYKMVNEKGGLATAKDLLDNQEPQSGLTTYGGPGFTRPRLAQQRTPRSGSCGTGLE
jgi:hypothetical protein